MKINHFDSNQLPQFTESMDLTSMDEEIDGIPEKGDTIRTKKMSMEGQVEKIEKSSYGTDQVFFRIADGRLMKTPLSNVTVVQKLADDNMVMEVAEDDDNLLNEISNELLSRYKTAAGKDASEADKKGDFAKGNKRFSGIVKATKKQFNNDAKKSSQSNTSPKNEGTMGGINRSAPAQDVSYEHVLDEVKSRWQKEQLAEDDDIGNIVRQQNSGRSPTETKEYNGWFVRYQTSPRVKGAPVEWMTWHSKRDPSTAKRGKSSSPEQAFQDATAFINDGAGEERKYNSDRVTIDFNINFTRQITPHGEPFFAKFEDGFLLVSLSPQSGFMKAHPRAESIESGEKHWCMSIPTKEAEAQKLIPNGRYRLGNKDEIDANTSMFDIQFQSVVQGTTDKMRMKEPGFTVASARAIEELYQGPWQGDPEKYAKAPKSTTVGGSTSLSSLVQDSIEAHGVKWAFNYYVKKHGMPPRHFKIYAGL